MLSAPADVVSPPVPNRDSVVDGFDALEVNDTVALTGPFACGLKVIARGRLLPGAIVIGNWLVGMLNKGLSAVAPETTRFPPLARPVLDNWTVFVDVVPVFTEPKSKGEGETVRMGTAYVLDTKYSKSADTD